MAVTWKKLAFADDVILKTLLTTRGDIIFRNATVPARLAKGTEGQVLAMGANDPGWEAPTGGAPDPHESTHVSGGSDEIDSALVDAAIPNLAAGKITSDRFPVDRLPAMTDEKYWVGTGANVEERAVPTAGDVAFGTYTGNAVYDRQITTGFVCKFVIIQQRDAAVVKTWLCLNPTGSGCLQIYPTDQVDDRQKPYLHATDGFALGDGHTEANADGTIYAYAAFA